MRKACGRCGKETFLLSFTAFLIHQLTLLRILCHEMRLSKVFVFICLFAMMLVTTDFRLEETPLLRLGCGAYAGIMSCVLCYPLDLVRTRLTVDRTNYYRGMCHVVAKVMKEEGVRGMFRGLLPSLAVCIPNFAITYTVYGTTKQYFLEHRISHMYLESTNSSNSTSISSGSSRSPHTAASSAAIATQLSPLGGIICGGLTGFFSSFLTFPIDLIKKRMQVR